jgi:hypothetical protein
MNFKVSEIKQEPFSSARRCMPDAIETNQVMHTKAMHTNGCYLKKG